MAMRHRAEDSGRRDERRRDVKNPILDGIKQTAVATFTNQYGYCGVVDSDNFALLNSGRDGEDFRVKIYDQEAIDAEKKGGA